MTTIICGAVTAKLVATPDVVRLVATHFAIENPAARFTAAKRYGTWDGKTRFLKRPGNTILTGLVPRLTALLKREGIRYTVRVDRAVRAVDVPLTDHLRDPRDPSQPLVLDDYQLRTAEMFMQWKRMIGKLPTGSGKTEVAGECIRRANRPTLWCTYQTDLMYQTRDRLAAELGFTPGIVGDGVSIVHPSLTIAMVQTLTDHLSNTAFMRRWEMVVADECELFTSATGDAVLTACSEAYYRLGLSGTPIGDDPIRNMTLEGLIGPVYVGARTQELVAAGTVPDAHVYMHVVPQHWYPTYPAIRDEVCPNWRANPRQLRTRGAELFASTYRQGIMWNAERNALIARLAHAEAATGKRVLVQITKVEHAAHLTPYMPDATFIHGDSKRELRIEAANALRDDGAIVIATDIWKRGVDIPTVNVVIPACGGAATSGTLQRIGRGKRRGGETLTVHDVFDGYGGEKHEAPKDYLRVHARRRLHDYKSEGFGITFVPHDQERMI